MEKHIQYTYNYKYNNTFQMCPRARCKYWIYEICLQ